MSSSPNSEMLESSEFDSLDAILEQVISKLESDEPLDKDVLAGQFPKYHSEVCQFIDNWLAMEHATSELAQQTQDHQADWFQLCGKNVGDYEILDVINRGGMGVVYRAKQRKLGRTVALKMVWDKHRDTVRFRMEAEAAAALHHPNIVAIHEVNEFEGLPYLSMQLIEGGSLQDRIQAGPLPLRESAQLVKTIADAVHYAHQRGILHRDLKPANVLMDQDFKPYVADFGLAKQMGSSVELTRSGAILGTPSYMSPEQAMGRVKSLTVAADVYGLGTILYAALTGEPPFRAESELLTLRKVIDDPPRPIRSLRPEIDRNLETICLKCLEKLPASRYGSARQLSDDLDRYLRGEPVVARPVSATERQWRWCRRNPGVAALCGAVFLLVCSTLFFSVHLAWSEYKSRLASEQSFATESSLREQANSARAEAEAKSAAAIKALGELYTSNGIWASQLELGGESLLWFSHAAQLEGLDRKEVESNRSRCMSWMAHSPTPVGAFQCSTPFTSNRMRQQLRTFGFRQGKTELMCQSDEGLLVWNFSSGERWSPKEQSLDATCGAWGDFGNVLAIGMSDGDVRVLDSDTYQTLLCVSLDEPVTNVCFVDSKDWIVAATDSNVQVFRSSDGKKIIPPIQHTSKILQVVVSATGKHLATVAEDKKTRIYDLSKVEAANDSLIATVEAACYVEPLKDHLSEFRPSFNADESIIYVRSANEKISAISTRTGKEVGKSLFTGRVQAVVADSSSKTWICCGDSYARLWSVERNKSGESIFAKHLPRLAHQDAVVSAEFGPTGIVATAGMDQLVKLWPFTSTRGSRLRWNDRETSFAVLPHQAQIALVKFSFDGKYLLTVQMDGLVRIWQLPSFRPDDYTMRIAPNYGFGYDSQEDKWLVMGSSKSGYSIDLRRTQDGQTVSNIPAKRFEGRGSLLGAEFSHYQKRFATIHALASSSSNTGELKYEIQLWSYPDGKPLGNPILMNSQPHDLSLHTLSSEMVVVDSKQMVYWCDTSKKELELVCIGDAPNETIGTSKAGAEDIPVEYSAENEKSHIRYSPDGEFFVVWGRESATIFDSKSKQIRTKFKAPLNKQISQLKLAPDGKSIAIIHQADKSVWIINAFDGSTKIVSQHPLAINSVQWSSNSRSLVTSCEDGKVRIINPVTGASLLPELSHTRGVTHADFSPNGTMIATLCLDGCFRVWDTRDGLLLMPPMRVPDAVRHFEFAADSAHLALIGVSGQIDVLNLSRSLQHQEIDLKHVSDFAELLSGKAVSSNGTVNLTSQQWLERWNDYRHHSASRPR